MILAIGDVGIRVLIELCQRILDGNGMPADWAMSGAIHILEGEGYIMTCGMHWDVKSLENAMKIIENVFDKRLRKVATIDDMQFGFIPDKGSIDATFIVTRLQEEYLAKQKKLYIRFEYLEKAFAGIQSKVMVWIVRINGMPDALVRAVMSLYKGARTKVTSYRKCFT